MVVPKDYVGNIFLRGDRPKQPKGKVFKNDTAFHGSGKITLDNDLDVLTLFHC